jgi:phosphinothricin acetyltransferase
MTIEVRAARLVDIPALTALHNALLSVTTIEWTDIPRTVADRVRWLRQQEERERPVLVAHDGNRLVGFASYGDFRDTARWPGYRFTVEHTVHVDRAYWGTGVGRLLVTALMDCAVNAHVHAMIGAIDSSNERSLRFHE